MTLLVPDDDAGARVAVVRTALASALCAALVSLMGCGRTCPASNVSSVTTIAVGRIGAPRQTSLAHSEADLGVLLAKASSSPSGTDSPAARAAFVAETDFKYFDVAVLNVDGMDDFQGTLRNDNHPDVAPFFDGPDDQSLVAVVGPHCGPIHDSSCVGPRSEVIVIPRALVFRVPKGTKLRVLRCTRDCPSKCGPHS